MLKDLINKVKANDAGSDKSGQPQQQPAPQQNNENQNTNPNPAPPQEQPAQANKTNQASQQAEGSQTQPQNQNSQNNQNAQQNQASQQDDSSQSADSNSQQTDNSQPQEGATMKSGVVDISAIKEQQSQKSPESGGQDNQAAQAQGQTGQSGSQTQPNSQGKEQGSSPQGNSNQTPAQPQEAPAGQEEDAKNSVRDSSTMKNISRESASMLNLLMEQIKALVEIGNNLNERTKESEKRINELSVEGEKTKEELKQFAAKMDVMEKNMEKFIGLYEVVTNQYNPFLEAGNGEEDENPDFSEDDSNEAPAQQEPASPEKKITVEDSISGQTSTVEPASESTSIPEQKTETPAQETEQNAQPQQPSQAQQPSQPAAQQPQLESSQPQQPTESKPVSAETSVPTGKPPSNGVASSGLVDISAIKKQMQENNGGSADSGSQPQETQPQQSGNAAVQEHEKPVSQPLSLSNGKSVKTVQDLFEELVYMDDNTFRNHVSDTKHEIADWVKNSLGNLQLSEKLRTLKTRSGIISEISSFIHSQPQEPPTSNDFKIGEKTVNDLEGLLDEIIYVDDNALSQIVTAQANPIADWIQNTVKNQALADELRPLSKKGDMVKAISKHLHEKNG